MPRTPIGIEPWIGDLRQRTVRVPPVLARRRPVDRGAYQRVTKPDPCAELEQPLGLGRVRGLDPDAEPSGGAPDQGRFADRLRRREEQEPAGVRGERREPTLEADLDARRKR